MLATKTKNKNKQIMKDNELWAARDKSGTLYLYRNKPTKDVFEWYSLGFSLVLPSALFPEVQWSDEEPTKVKLVIDK